MKRRESLLVRRAVSIQGNGQPHWHLLCDVSDLPRHRINLKLAWHRWRDQWEMGGVDLPRKKDCQSSEHAVLCVTSCMTKPTASYPDWVLGTPSIRFVGASQAVGPVASKMKVAAKARSVAGAATKTYAPRRTPAARMAECGERTKVFQRQIDSQTGEVRLCCRGELPASPSELPALFPGSFTVTMVSGPPVIHLTTGDANDIRQALLHRAGWTELRKSRRDARERLLIGADEPSPHS